MARIIEKIVEAVIEDPVVDIFAEPIDEGNAAAGLVLYLILALSDPFQGSFAVASTPFEYVVETLQSKIS